MAAIFRTIGPRTGHDTALAVVGGRLPLDAEEFARRAYLYARNPLRNPVKEVMDAFDGDVAGTPPLLGIFSDIPSSQLRESDAISLAKAGFTWVVMDGEHTQTAGRAGRDTNALLLRNGITPVQRLHREARSEHGDALCTGARATMMPYGTTFREAEEYFRCVNFPQEGAATPFDRGAFPVRNGSFDLLFSPQELRAGERETQAWLQFETTEYIANDNLRDQILELMVSQGKNKACGFVGLFDASMRAGSQPWMEAATANLFQAAVQRGIYMGRICGSGSASSPEEIEDSMVRAINAGCRLISVHYFLQDLAYHGAEKLAAPFWRACQRCYPYKTSATLLDSPLQNLKPGNGEHRHASRSPRRNQRG